MGINYKFEKNNSSSGEISILIVDLHFTYLNDKKSMKCKISSNMIFSHSILQIHNFLSQLKYLVIHTYTEQISLELCTKKEIHNMSNEFASTKQICFI